MMMMMMMMMKRVVELKMRIIIESREGSVYAYVI